MVNPDDQFEVPRAFKFVVKLLEAKMSFLPIKHPVSMENHNINLMAKDDLSDNQQYH